MIIVNQNCQFLINAGFSRTSYSEFQYFNEGRIQTLSIRTAVFHLVQNVFLESPAYPNPSSGFPRTSYSEFLYFSEGFTQTLSTIPLCGIFVFFNAGLPTHCVRRLPYTSTRGLPKPFQQITSCFVGFFASHLFTKASF